MLNGKHSTMSMAASLFFFFLIMFLHCLDSEDKQVQLITTLDNSEVDLLTLEYVKVRMIYIITIELS